MLNLRSYQKECLESIVANFRSGVARQLVSLPTGSGKTVIFSYLIKNMGLKALVLAHTTELIHQSKEKIQMVCGGLDVGIVNGFSKEFEKEVVISSVQSARIPKNLEKLKEQQFEIVIADEAHHYSADSQRMILNELGFGSGTDKLLVGFTATPFRNDSKGLGEIFDVVSYEKNIKEIIENGYLCRPSGIKVPIHVDFSQVESSKGDFRPSSLAKVMDTPEINDIVVSSYVEKGRGRKTICFGTSVDHAFNLKKAFEFNGIPAGLIHGKMQTQERKQILEDFSNDNIRVLCNCQVLTEGFDSPDVSCIIIARPTRSRGLYMQMCGRGLRLYPDKNDCLLIDFCGENHNICCSSTILFEDADKETQEERARERKEKLNSIPPNLSQKLKGFLINFDPLSRSFNWNRYGDFYELRGIRDARVEIMPSKQSDRCDVVFSRHGLTDIISKDLTFEYAFSSANDFAKDHRDMFVISDREAPWRKKIISEKQLKTLRSKGYRAGIDQLTRGQACDILSNIFSSGP